MPQILKQPPGNCPKGQNQGWGGGEGMGDGQTDGRMDRHQTPSKDNKEL